MIAKMSLSQAASATVALCMTTMSIADEEATAGDKVKPVEVINLPDVQDVHVTNPVAAAPAARIQIVGVTSTLYTGNLGGPWGATEKCDAEFPGTRMCTIEEARRTMPPFPVIPEPGAWTDPGIPTSYGSERFAGCGGGLRHVWRQEDGGQGTLTAPDGAWG
jgi:hypothetical protein